MSGYPYGNSGGGYPNYPPNNNFQAPPPAPTYGDNQSCASLYGTYGSSTPSNNNYSAPSYGGNQMPGGSYDYGGNSGYSAPPPSGGQMPGSSYGYGGNNSYPTVPPSGGYMPDSSYGYGGNSSYPTAPPSSGQMPSSTFNQPPQQYGGFGNAQHQPPYPPEPPSASSFSGGIYPNLTNPTNYSGAGSAPTYQPQPPYQQQPFYPQDQSSIALASLEQHQGTVFPLPNFNAEADCNGLRHAMQGVGTNERAVIDIAANRSNTQRQQIKHLYKSMFGIDLVKQLGGELSGNFKETITALFDAPADFDAWSIHRALNMGKRGTLSEVLLTRTNNEIRAIIEAYRRVYNKDLEKEITSRVSGNDFKRMLVSAVQANRGELSPQQIQQARQMGIESVIDRNRARQDADDLYKAGAGKWGTDEKTFNSVFFQRNYYQLRATFEEYQKKYRQTMAQVIRSEFSGDTKDAYLILFTCIQDRPTIFAERLHKAISGLGTTDTTLIRVIVTRSEIDLAQIKQRYQQMYNRSLAQDVSGDTSGDYKRILLAIVK